MMRTFEKSNVTMNNDRELIVTRLMQIDGIAIKTAEALYEIGIRSYDDLIEYLSKETAEEISKALREHNVKRPPAFIKREDWTAQAIKLSKQNNTAHKIPDKEPKVTKNSDKASRITDSIEHYAEFTVFFEFMTDEDGDQVLKTTVYDEKNFGKEKIFMGIDTAPWVNWIIGRAQLPVTKTIDANSVEIATEFETLPTPTLEKPEIEIFDIQISEIPVPPDAWKKKLMVEIRFRVIGSGAETMTEDQIPFRIEVYTVDYQNRISKLVASEQSKLKPQIFYYMNQIEFTMPDIGNYELRTIINLLPPGELIGYFHGPRFKVVL
jgi:hypothetical protein